MVSPINTLVPSLLYLRAVQQPGILGNSMVPAIAGMDISTVRHDARDQDISILRLGIVFERIGIDGIIFIDQLHAVEECYLRVRCILSPK